MSLPQQLVECVVNVSEGRDTEVLAALSAAIEGVPDCALLHRDLGAGAHRTVFTFAGTPDGVFEAAFEVYRVAARHVDMRHHRGEHPRIGAVDVCPFVPIRSIGMRDVVARTQVLAERVAAAFKLPVYLYEESATAEHRRNLAAVRRGEYEGLAAKVLLPDWRPDFGPDFNARLGATVMGARPFLIAWNINLEAGAPLSVAKELAGRLRGSGTKAGPGLFPYLKAIGWHLPDLGRCQISCNVVDARKADLARVYLTAVSLAADLGARVTGSELIGLIPEQSLRKAGKPFVFDGDAEAELAAAVSVLGLDDLAPFDTEERVFEKVLRAKWAT